MRSSICLRTRQQFPRATGFSRNLCFLMEPDQPGQASTLELLHQQAESCDECVAFFQREWQGNITQELPAVATKDGCLSDSFAASLAGSSSKVPKPRRR